MDGSDYNAKYYLAHAYRLNEQYAEALELLKQLAQENKGTRRGTEAESYVKSVEKKLEESGGTQSAEGGTDTAGEDQAGNGGNGDTSTETVTAQGTEDTQGNGTAGEESGSEEQ